MLTKPVRRAIGRRQQQGIALVITLAMLVLVTFAIVAFFSKATLNRTIENSSVGGVRAGVLGRSCVEAIVGELQKEMIAMSDPSTTKPVNGNYTLRPKTPQDSVPQVVLGTGIGSSGAEKFKNLVKQSVSSQALFTDSGNTSKMKAVLVKTDAPSLDGRVISAKRWSTPSLIGDSNGLSGFDSSDQLPEWVPVTRTGVNGTVAINNAKDSKSSDYVIGRFAYNIYNEGGLLDVNIAGYPSVVSSSTNDLKIVKGTPGGADLTQIPGVPDQNAVDQLVNWRNNAGIANYASQAPSILTGYTKLVTQYSGSAGFLQRWIDPALASSDQRFINRQDLIHYIKESGQSGITTAALPYLTTFTRTLDRPSYWPDPNRPKIVSGPGTIQGTSPKYSGGNNAYQSEDVYNPAFRSIRVATAFTRNDQTQAVVGEPLVKKRFALSRLCWITYKGPSATLDPNDPVYQRFVQNGISSDLIKQGTAQNIQKYFGLTWFDATNSGSGSVPGGYWKYNHGISVSNGGTTVGTLSAVAGLSAGSAREPDFFELLQAAVNVGSLAKAWAGIGGIGNGASSSSSPFNVPVIIDSRVVYQVLQLGANIIDEVNPTQFPTHIEFEDVPGNVFSVYGTTDLPYANSLSNIGFIAKPAVPAPANSGAAETGVTLQDPGLGAFLAVPTIWNPFDSNGPAAVTGPSNLRIVLGNPAPVSNFAPNPVSTPWLMGPTSTSWNFIPYEAGTTSGTVSQPRVFSNWTSENSTALNFDNSPLLYREPTALLQYSVPSGSNLAPDRNNVIPLSAGAGMNWAHGIPDCNNSAISVVGQPLLGFLLGTFPIRWTTSGTTYTTAFLVPFIPKQGICIRMEYLSGASWVPYKENWIIGENVSVVFPLSENGTASAPYVLMPNGTSTSIWNGSTQGRVPSSGVNQVPLQVASWDPRSTRFGWFGDLSQFQILQTSALIPSEDTVQTLRPGTAIGSQSTHDAGSASYGWYTGNGQHQLGLMPQNILQRGYSYFADADGIVRRGMAGAVNSAVPGNTTGLPLSTGNNASRPMILHRPFQSVAELGYVFSDTPWRNIDFSTSESGFSAFLDVFCINDDSRQDCLSAGRVDLNSKQVPVISAILAQTIRDETGAIGSMNSAEAANLAQALVTRTAKSPLMNIADIVGRYTAGFTNSNSQPYDGFSEDLGVIGGGGSSPNTSIQRLRETAMRALADNGQAGTWNLLIDVVAQSGRYPSSAKDLKQFMVEGEQRYWVHVAIDRQTGQVIDEQIEQVNE